MLERVGEREIPISIDLVLRHLRVEDDVEPIELQLITGYVTAAVEHCADFTRRELFRQVYRQTQPSSAAVELRRSPVAEVQSVTVAGDTLPPETYRVDRERWPHVLLVDFPPAGEMVVEYAAGYTVETLPEQIRQAVLLLTGHWYEHREEVVIGTITAELPMAAKNLMWMQRMEL